MIESVTQFAAVHAEKADMFTSLGLDWKALGSQTVAFLVLLGAEIGRASCRERV